MSLAYRACLIGSLVSLPLMVHAQPPSHPQAPIQSNGSMGSVLKGTVLETMDSGGYTYLQIQTEDGAKPWIAIPASKVVKGQRITLLAGTEMGTFNSKTLNRTFDSIIFSPGRAETSSDHPAQPSPGGTVPPGKAKIHLAKAPGSSAYTVEEIHRLATTLVHKTVSVRGRVVKASMGILGRNWLHLQDGSGHLKSADYDLVVTTSQKAKVGDTVIASGTVSTDADFGAGYRYRVLIEQAALNQK